MHAGKGKQCYLNAKPKGEGGKKKKAKKKKRNYGY